MALSCQDVYTWPELRAHATLRGFVQRLATKPLQLGAARMGKL